MPGVSGMNYQRIYTNSEHYYSIGIDNDSGQYIIEVIITWVAWYSIYFRLNSKEIASFRRDQDSLTELSYKMARDKGKFWYRHRLLHSERKCH
jgi:hypothetical protein